MLVAADHVSAKLNVVLWDHAAADVVVKFMDTEIIYNSAALRSAISENATFFPISAHLDINKQCGAL